MGYCTKLRAKVPLFKNYIHSKQGHVMVYTKKTYIFTKSEFICVKWIGALKHTVYRRLHACTVHWSLDMDPEAGSWLTGTFVYAQKRDSLPWMSWWWTTTTTTMKGYSCILCSDLPKKCSRARRKTVCKYGRALSNSLNTESRICTSWISAYPYWFLIVRHREVFRKVMM